MSVANTRAPHLLLHPVVFLLFFLFVVQSTIAQVYPVQGSATLLPPYSLRLSDYATSTTERLITNVLLTDVTKAELQIRFRLIITGQNVKIETKPEYLGTGMTLQGGVPLRLSNVELAEYFDVNHLNFSGVSKSEFMKTGLLPEGYYTFCWEVYEAHRNVKISNSICAPAWLILNDPPLVNLPRHGEKLKALSPQNVMIQWTPRHTGSPNSAFTTEYEIKIIELWPADRNPNDAMLSQPAIYEATTSNTTLIYGPDATQLEPGRTYALRVQAKAMTGAEQTDLFKNNGYSETITFIYGDACDAPAHIAAQTVGATKFSLTWDEAPAQTGYTVRFRETGKGDVNWYTTSTVINNAEITGLKPGTTYEYEVKSTCGNFESSYSSVATLTTEATKEKTYSCGVIPPDFNLDPSQVLPVLKVGEVVNAGDFDVTITKVAGANGSFSGEGAIVVPFLNQARARVTFTGITVNQDHRMVNGVMNVTGAAIEVVPAEIVSTMDKMVQAADKAVAVADSLAKVLNPEKPEVNTFIAAEEIKVEGGIGRVYRNPATGQVIVEDKNGKSQTLPPGKDIALVDDTGKGVLVNSKGGITNTTAELAHTATRRELNLTLTFAKSANTRKGLDLQKEEALKGNYEKLGNNYYVAWKAVATEGGDGVKSINSDKQIKQGDIRFAQDGTKIEAENNLEMLVYSVATGTRSSVVAKVVPKDTTKKEQILGKLNVVSYEQETKKLHIIRVNNATFTMEAKAIEAILNEIYGQAVVNWEVDVASNNLLVTGMKNPFDDGSSGLLSNYTDDMRMVINAQGDLTDDEYYLFVIDKPASGSKLGYMPRGKKAGFIFTDSHGMEDTPARNARIVITMAHELGHGAFTLKHTFADNTSLPQGSTDNLMDYNNGTQLWKLQWDRIHDPATVLGLFEGDEGGASFSLPCFGIFDDCDDVLKVLKNIREAVIEKDKLITKLPSDKKRRKEGSLLKIEDTDFGRIAITFEGEKDVVYTVDPTSYENFKDAVLGVDGKIDYQTGFVFKVKGRIVAKVLVYDDDQLEKKIELLKKYLFEGEKSSKKDIFLDNVTFTSQFDESIFGECTGCWKNKCCMRACQYMLGNTAVANCTDPTIAKNSSNLPISETLTTAYFNDNSEVYDKNSYNAAVLQINSDAALKAIEYIREKLEKKRPIMIGVHHERDKAPPNNANRATCHYMIVVGIGRNQEGNIYVNFYDPGVYTNMASKGTSKENKLIFDAKNGTIKGIYRGQTYSITEVFKTQ